MPVLAIVQIQISMTKRERTVQVLSSVPSQLRKHFIWVRERRGGGGGGATDTERERVTENQRASVKTSQ